AEKARAGRDVPYINWRYILFNWNDSDEEMAEARRRAEAVGVDRLCWEITDHPSTRSHVVSHRALLTTRPSAARRGTTATWATRFPAPHPGHASRCAARSRASRGCPSS